MCRFLLILGSVMRAESKRARPGRARPVLQRTTGALALRLCALRAPFSLARGVRPMGVSGPSETIAVTFFPAVLAPMVLRAAPRERCAPKKVSAPVLRSRCGPPSGFGCPSAAHERSAIARENGLPRAQ